ncbi:helix-turn-helix transcriptional regulator [Actinocorallia sp. B10E7]|uniref:helix-turn-helix domain-containing protein n=1 Tax=Actinocorallia sp. B10E7 TaxID=3153558 RepID=UPI00325EA370
MASQNSEVVGPQKSFVMEMRARREAVGLSRNKLAETLGCTPQWLSKVENYDKTPSEGLADDLDTYWKTGGTFRRLWEQMVEARKQGLVPSAFRPLIDAEREAVQINIYEPLLIPGIFQSAEYARRVLSTGFHQENLEELLAIRMERQKLYEKADPPAVFLVIREAVIRDLPLEVRIDQCKKLLDLISWPRVFIQVIPSSTHVFEPTGFQILSFAGAADVAYVEGANGHGQMFVQAEEVRGLDVLFNVIRAAALPVEETEHLIHTIMEGT